MPTATSRRERVGRSHPEFYMAHCVRPDRVLLQVETARTIRSVGDSIHEVDLVASGRILTVPSMDGPKLIEISDLGVCSLIQMPF